MESVGRKSSWVDGEEDVAGAEGGSNQKFSAVGKPHDHPSSQLLPILTLSQPDAFFPPHKNKSIIANRDN
jgi:hypothetical protein